MAALGKAFVELTLDKNAAEFLGLLRSITERLDDHERQTKELWRRIHSLNEMIEERPQRQQR